MSRMIFKGGVEEIIEELKADMDVYFENSERIQKQFEHV